MTFNWKISIVLVIAFSLCCFINSNEESSSSDMENPDYPNSNVVDITPKTFYENLKKYEKIVLYFSSKTCTYCVKFEPEYQQVASESLAKNLGFGFLKIDGPDNDAFSSSFRVSQTPVLLFIEKVDGQLLKSKYKGNLTARAIGRYLGKKHTYRPRELTNYASFVELVKNSKKFLIFFGDKTKHADTLNKFVTTALDNEIENIFWTVSSEFYQKYNLNQGDMEVVLHSVKDGSLDEGVKFDLPLFPNYLYSRKGVIHLVSVYTRKTLVEFKDGELSSTGFGNLVENTICLAVYANKKSNDYKKMVEDMTKTSVKYRRDCNFFKTQFDSKEAHSFIEAVGITENDLPTFVNIQLEGVNGDDNNKFVRKSVNATMVEGDYSRFYEDFRAGRIDKYTLSEPVPKNPVDHHGVYKMVGTTFKDDILNKAAGKHAIVKICTDTVKCHNFELRFSRVVKKLRNNKDLFFAKIDLRLNEFEYLNIGVTPSVALIFDGLNRFENIRFLEGELSTKNLIEFIDKHLKSKNKNHVLQVEKMNDDHNNEQIEKYSPIKQEQEPDAPDEEQAEGEKKPEGEQGAEGEMATEAGDGAKYEDGTENGKGEVYHGKEGEQGEHVDLDSSAKGTEMPEEDHIKEGL